MRLALPVHNGRISPVFDVAARLLVVDVNGEEIAVHEEVELSSEDLATRADEVARRGVDTLICAGISAPMAMALQTAGVQVIPQTCGPAEAVAQAFAAHQLTEQNFLMPGCCGRRRRFGGRGRGGHGGRGGGRRPMRNL